MKRDRRRPKQHSFLSHELSQKKRMTQRENFLGLADDAVEGAIYDSHAIQDVAVADLATELVQDATTLSKSRRLLGGHGLTRRSVEGVNAHPAERGLLLGEATMVDATIVEAPPLTKNKADERAPATRQTKRETDGTSNITLEGRGRMQTVHKSRVGIGVNVGFHVAKIRRVCIACWAWLI